MILKSGEELAEAVIKLLNVLLVMIKLRIGATEYRNEPYVDDLKFSKIESVIYTLFALFK